jgi:serine phosphatase RsbU (regulator of sigma subunit)
MGWSALLLAGVGAVVWTVLVVRRRILLPLETLSGAMLGLADDDLETPLPKLRHADEIGATTDTLRVVKANALRSDRLERERAVLHARLEDTYKQLRRDLEAAASIQTAMLPAAGAVGGVRHRGLFRPSSLIAGDTYNVVERHDGSVGFFQVDVAGHGAPAALISVASHHTLSQALLKSENSRQIEAIAAEINRDWPEDLPYFTMILGEIDSSTGEAAIVQAGHPSPLLIPGDAAVRFLGDGGFPVGMIAAATYERLSLQLGPGERLLLYSDGLVDGENPEGQPFSEERLLAVVTEHARRPTPVLLEIVDGDLRKWRGSENLEDDLSVLVLERHPAEVGNADSGQAAQPALG